MILKNFLLFFSIDNFFIVNRKQSMRDFWSCTNRDRDSQSARGGKWKWIGGGHVYERVTSCRIARLNNCDPPVTSRYKRRTVGGGDGRGKHIYTVCARCWGKISFFLRFHKIYQTPHPAESNRYTLRLTAVRSSCRLLSGETGEACCATSRFLIKW